MSIKEGNNANEFISYTALANHLSISKGNITMNSMDENHQSLPVFLFKVNIKSLTIQAENLHTKLQCPILAIKFLNYPIIVYPISSVNFTHQKIPIDQSSSIYFELPLPAIQSYLKTIPLHIVFLDKATKVIYGSARIHLSLFADNAFLSYSSSSLNVPNPRRKIINLMSQNMKTTIGTIDISLIIRREYFMDEINKEEHEECVNKSNKQIRIYIAQPVDYNNKEVPYGIEEGLHSQWSFEYNVRDMARNDNEGNGNDKEGHCHIQNRLGIFTGTKFPNPNTIFYNNKPEKTKGENQTNNNTTNNTNTNKKNNTTNNNNTTDNNNNIQPNEVDTLNNNNLNNNIELQSINNSLISNTSLLIKIPPQEPRQFYNIISSQNIPIKPDTINYDKFLYESYIKHINNSTRLRRIKSIIKDTSSPISPSHPHQKFHRVQSCDKIDYYHERDEIQDHLPIPESKRYVQLSQTNQSNLIITPSNQFQ